MDLHEIESRFKEIRLKNDPISLDLFMDEIEDSKDSADFFLSFIDRKPASLFFILLNRSDNNDFLKQLRNMFEKTSWYSKLRKGLNFPDPSVRRFFIKDITRARSSIFMKILVDNLKDSDFEVRKEIIDALGRIESEQSITLLISLLDDLDARIIKELSNTLYTLGNKAIPYFSKYINSPSVRLRMNLLDVLKRIATIEIITPLLYLNNDNNDEIRISAQQFLISLTDKITVTNNKDEIKQLLTFLVAMLEKNDPRLMAVTIKSIMKFKKEGAQILIEKIESVESDVQKNEMINVIKEAKVPEKIYLIFEMILSSDILIKERGLDLLSKYYFDDKYSEAVLLLLQDFALSNINYLTSVEKEAIGSFIIKQKMFEKIVRNLKSPDSLQRITSVDMIGIISDPKTAPLLLTLSKDPVWEVRAAVTKVLGSMANDELLPYLLELMNDPEVNVQAAAVEAIGKLKSQKAREIVFRLIDSPNSRLRDAAAQIIAKESLKKYIDSFDQLNENSKVRVTKLMELLEVETERILSSEIKSLNPEERRRVLEIISHLKNKSKFKKIVDHAIKDPDKNVRAMVVNLLLDLGDKEMVVELLKLLNDPDKRVRANVIEAIATLGNVNTQSVIKLLHPFLKDTNNRIRANAVMSLYSLGYKEAINETSEMLKDSSEFMRASAVYCIGKLKAIDKSDLLLKYRNDPSTLVRKNLVRAFKKLNKSEYLSSFFSDPSQEVKSLAKELSVSKEVV